MSSNNIHDEWLSLVEISGPFLAPPVLNEAFPQGLDLLDPAKRKRLRQTYEEWREALDSEDPEFAKLHQAWIKEVISNCLGFDEDSKGAHLKFGAAMPSVLAVQIPEQGVTLAPEYVLVDEQHDSKPLLLIQSYASGVDLQAAMSIDGWSATPADRMVQLCRLTGCRLGLVTDGERWMLIDAPVGAVTTFASWYARLWIQEPITLQAFVHLLGIRRFFVATGEQIPALIDKSLQHQDEVTTALGEQVQRAVEVLIQSLDRADQDRNRELLKDVTPAELYEAGLTVMMRLVFLLSAEERGLLLMGDECYEENYAISTLRMQLRSESEEILERRWDAWSRLLSVFRAVYGGIDHENMRLPALGGSLFDPDRFPFLEGRTKGSNWHKEPAKPLPIDNRTVLLLLEAIQQYQGRSLSYRALDVEQIGYVYEGLLERTVKRTSEVILDVGATRSAEKPLVSLAELESLSQSSESALLDCLVERTGSSITRVKNALAKPTDDQLLDRLLAACMGNIDLRNQIKPFANLLRIDPWGYPLVYPADSFVVALGSDRRETGSHYTPKSLTETIVTRALVPLVYKGAKEGDGIDAWELKSPHEILDLKVCDPAMGSGAFLVQACRWLSDRLVESWANKEKVGLKINSSGEILGSDGGGELLSTDKSERVVIARQLVSERCLYGVDINPLAVELAKLSIWLITLSKDRPFGFLDHNLKYGDTLLGIINPDQLIYLSMSPSDQTQKGLFGASIVNILNDALKIRSELRCHPINTIRDVHVMARLDDEVRHKLNLPILIADAFIGSILKVGENPSTLGAEIASINIAADGAFSGDDRQLTKLSELAKSSLSFHTGSGGKTQRHPFHWPLEFPEVYLRGKKGFDAVIGNPPFIKGISIGAFFGGDYRNYLVENIGNKKRASYADLCAFFLLRYLAVASPDGYVSMVATNTISQGDTREIGLDQLGLYNATIYWADANMKWHGSATVTVSCLGMKRGEWAGSKLLNDCFVTHISQFLSETKGEIFSPKKIESNAGIAFKGSTTGCAGFVLDDSEAQNIFQIDEKYKKVIQKFLGGQEFNNSPTQSTNRWVINFRDWNIDVASEYPICLKILEERVKPYFDARTGQIHEKDYWKFSDKRLDSYVKISTLNRVLFHAFTSKHLSFGFVSSSDIVYSAPHVVVGLAGYRHFGILQSSIHLLWVLELASTMRAAGIRYAPSDLFDTFPFPDGILESQASINSNSNLDSLAKNYYDLRSSIMLDRNIGLTDIYNAFHDPLNSDEWVRSLRIAHVEMDCEIARLYGLDSQISYEFIDTKLGPRYLPVKASSDLILTTLYKLNSKLGFKIEKKLSKRTKEKKSDINLNPMQSSLGFELE